MPATRADIIDRTLEKTHIWLNELAQELGTDDLQHTYRILRGFLHALRDRLSVDETAQLAAQLPTLIRGVYYEGWDPSKTPQRYRGLAPFLDRIAAEAVLHGETEASYAAVAAARVLRHHISEGEIEDVMGLLPAELRALLEGGS